MKKLLSLSILLIVIQFANSQALGYSDLAQLFSRDDFNGSARFKALSGAFGALGGDIGSMVVNPAGLSVFRSNKAIATLQSRSTDINTIYYGTSRVNQDEFFNISQAGAVLVFDDLHSTEWSKIALGFNYRIRADLDDTFLSEGNSGFATFTDFPLDNNTTPLVYDVAENQRFTNFFTGEITEFNIGFSAIHRDKLHLGMAINLVGLNFAQQSILRETNNDGNGNVLDARFYQENFTTGNGFSFAAGVIYKPTQSLRFGLSYQSPTWFSEIIEDTNITNNDGYFGDTEIRVSNDNIIYDNTVGTLPFQSLLYRLRTPSRVTLSSAVVFGKLGLISLDYSSRNFQNMNLSGDNFIEENQFFSTGLRRTNNLNIGTEWRFSRLSLRAGYRYQESPDINAIDSDNLQSYSYGIGYNFGAFKLDLSYSDSNNTGIYNFYPQFPQVDAAELQIDNRIVTASLVFNL